MAFDIVVCAFIAMDNNRVAGTDPTLHIYA